MKCVGFTVGDGTIIVGPIHIYGTVEIGKNCWCNRNLTVHGNGFVRIGDNCDIAPDVCFLTGGHEIGDKTRRAGPGEVYSISVGEGSWIGARSTILGDTVIGKGCLIASCSCVTKNVDDNMLVGGVPAKTIRNLAN